HELPPRALLEDVGQVRLDDQGKDEAVAQRQDLRAGLGDPEPGRRDAPLPGGLGGLALVGHAGLGPRVRLVEQVVVRERGAMPGDDLEGVVGAGSRTAPRRCSESAPSRKRAQDSAVLPGPNPRQWREWRTRAEPSLSAWTATPRRPRL